jgi:hypothetical protein
MWKRGNLRRYFTSGATLTAMALALSLTSIQPANANSEDELRLLREQMAQMAKRLEELETKQADTQEQVQKTQDSAVITSGKNPGSFILPGTGTSVEISGYVKADFIYGLNEGNGDVFVPENISTSGKDEERFRAHARQTRLRVKTSTPTDMGPLKTLIEGDFFGNGGNQIFSNSTSFRLRHAWASIGGLSAGQYWSNFMPIESYPGTIDFNGPAGLPFIRQAQLRYTHKVDDQLTLRAPVENSEFNGHAADGTVFGEGRGGLSGVNAGIDKAPDFTAAAVYKDDWGLVKLAGLASMWARPTIRATARSPGASTSRVTPSCGRADRSPVRSLMAMASAAT